MASQETHSIGHKPQPPLNSSPNLERKEVPEQFRFPVLKAKIIECNQAFKLFRSVSYNYMGPKTVPEKLRFKTMRSMAILFAFSLQGASGSQMCSLLLLSGRQRPRRMCLQEVPLNHRLQVKTAKYCLQASLPSGPKQCPATPSSAPVTALLNGDSK